MTNRMCCCASWNVEKCLIYDLVVAYFFLSLVALHYIMGVLCGLYQTTKEYKGHQSNLLLFLHVKRCLNSR